MACRSTTDLVLLSRAAGLNVGRAGARIACSLANALVIGLGALTYIAGEPGALKGAHRVRREAARKRPKSLQKGYGTSPCSPPYAGQGLWPKPYRIELSPHEPIRARRPCSLYVADGLTVRVSGSTNPQVRRTRDEFGAVQGIRSGASNAIRDSAGVRVTFGIGVLGAVLSAQGGYASAPAFVAGLSSAVWVAAAAVAAAAGAALLLPRSRKVTADVVAAGPGAELEPAG